MSKRYTEAEFEKLTEKYGSVSSWAIWNQSDLTDTSVISKNISELHTNYVLLGLNISKSIDLSYWQNFHSTSHDRKLTYACNHTKLRGSYITDIFKGIAEPNSGNIEAALSPQVIQSNVNFFIEEMRDISIQDETIFLAFGSKVTNYFTKYYSNYFPKNQLISYYHYSYYGCTDQQWVEGLWQKLGIEQTYQNCKDRASVS